MDYASKRKKLSYNVITNRSLKYVDYPFFFIVLILLVMGLVFLYSASALYAVNKGYASLFYAKKQALYMLLGFGLMAAAARMDLEKLRHYIKPAVIAALWAQPVPAILPRLT